MTLKSLHTRYLKLIRNVAIMGVTLLLATGSLTQWSAQATYLKEHKLYDPLGAAINAARTQDGNAALFPHFGNEQKLTASDGAANVFFGTSVAVSGATVVVGAPFDSVGGAAYVFNRQGGSWVETQKLTASDATRGAEFGWSLAISGATLVVGASGDSDGVGAAYVFNREGASWVEEQKLIPSDGGLGLFGFSVAISGSTVVVGSPFSGDIVQGAVYVFTP